MKKHHSWNSPRFPLFLVCELFYRRLPCDVQWLNIYTGSINNFYFSFWWLSPFLSKVPMSPQTLEGIRHLFQPVLCVPPVSATMASASLPPKLWFSLPLFSLRVTCCLMRVRFVQYCLFRLLLFFLLVLVQWVSPLLKQMFPLRQ